VALIEAHITKVEQEIGSEWAKIHTDHDQVKQLSTKRPELIQEAAALKRSGALAGIDYAEQTKTVQTEAGPRTYRNYYYNGGGPLHDGASADDGIDRVQPQGRAEDPERSWRICLQSGGKLAVATLPLMPVDQRDFETQKTIARAWAEFFYFTPPPSGPRSTPSMGAYSEPEVDQAIPF
jgi:hypothetical protein